MSDTVTAALEGLRIRERELELDACAVKARVEEVRELILALEHPRRRPGRPRKISVVEAEPQPEPEEGAAA